MGIDSSAGPADTRSENLHGRMAILKCRRGRETGSSVKEGSLSCCENSVGLVQRNIHTSHGLGDFPQ